MMIEASNVGSCSIHYPRIDSLLEAQVQSVPGVLQDLLLQGPWSFLIDVELKQQEPLAASQLRVCKAS